jgi:hypothetical protein
MGGCERLRLGRPAALARYMRKRPRVLNMSGFRRRASRERIVPSLQEFRVVVPLSPAKPVGLADLGAPAVEGALVKKGRAHEFAQVLTDGKIGRRFQDLRVIAIHTFEAGVPSHKLFVQFEVFGDDTAVSEAGVGFDAVLQAGETRLANLSSSRLFLPYANFWYPNRFVFDAPAAAEADRLVFIAKSEEVRCL